MRGWLRGYGYRNVRTPVLEHTRLFARGIGEVTDIVEKEMYTFTDALNGESLTMRPEMTAGIVRASIEHNLLYDRPQRVYSIGPVFRHERPQRAATASSTRSTSRRWASPVPTWTLNSSSCWPACGSCWA